MAELRYPTINNRTSNADARSRNEAGTLKPQLGTDHFASIRIAKTVERRALHLIGSNKNPSTMRWSQADSWQSEI